MTKDEEKCLEILKKIPAAQKLKASFALYDLAKQMVKAEIKRQNPAIDQLSLNKMVNQRFSNQ